MIFTVWGVLARDKLLAVYLDRPQAEFEAARLVQGGTQRVSLLSLSSESRRAEPESPAP